MATATVAEAEPTSTDEANAFLNIPESGWTDAQLRKYPFQTIQIPRLSHTDPQAEILINNEVIMYFIMHVIVYLLCEERELAKSYLVKSTLTRSR